MVVEMVDGVGIPENNNKCSAIRELHLSSPGSKSMACGDSLGVNVGYPISSSRKKYQPTSIIARELKRLLGSQMMHSTLSMGKPCTWGRHLGNFNFEEETL